MIHTRQGPYARIVLSFERYSASNFLEGTNSLETSRISLKRSENSLENGESVKVTSVDSSDSHESLESTFSSSSRGNSFSDDAVYQIRSSISNTNVHSTIQSGEFTPHEWEVTRIRVTRLSLVTSRAISMALETILEKTTVLIVLFHKNSKPSPRSPASRLECSSTVTAHLERDVREYERYNRTMWFTRGGG